MKSRRSPVLVSPFFVSLLDDSYDFSLIGLFIQCRTFLALRLLGRWWANSVGKACHRCCCVFADDAPTWVLG